MLGRVSIVSRRSIRILGREWPWEAFTSLLAIVLLAGLPRALHAGDDAPASADGQNERAVEIKQIAGSLSAVRAEGAERRSVPLRGEPLFRWNDPTRKFSDASLWAWGENGRPAAGARVVSPFGDRG
jgi:hypothetical protein